MTPKLLDTYCGTGGAGEGYRRQGFDVTGVDLKPQRYAPGMFVQADAIAFLREGGADGYDAIHASPPCQHYVTLSRGDHPDLIGPTRDALEATGKPWILENVERARAWLRDPVLICGAALGLTIEIDGQLHILRRHRLFESNVPIVGTGCGCKPGDGRSIGIYGGGGRKTPRTDGAGGDTAKANRDQARLLMEMPWATRVDMNEAIPPRYTEHLAPQLHAHLNEGDRR